MKHSCETYHSNKKHTKTSGYVYKPEISLLRILNTRESVERKFIDFL